MHMADALISPAVGGTLWAMSAGLIAHCARRVRRTARENLVPMMGVLGAFVFSAQMINFSIPGTGSSGHLGGGLLLAMLLGPSAAFLVIASVLTVQAFFFADGGLLALGCNIINLGFYPAFVAYPLIYRPLARDRQGTPLAWAAAVLAAVVGLQLGAFSVVMETTASGVSALPFKAFALLMQPVHLAIGIVEGLATATVVAFVARARPEALHLARPRPEAVSVGRPGLPTVAVAQTTAKPLASARPILIGLLIAAAACSGVASWFASTHPDGLEWAIAKVSGEPAAAEPRSEAASEPWPAVSGKTSASGLVGGLITLGMAGAIGFALKLRRPADSGRPGGH